MEEWKMNDIVNEEISTARGSAPTALTAASFKSAYKPIWCPGCGDYTVLSSVTKALAAMGVAPKDCAVVSGIGCSSRIPAYTTCYGFHGVHGRSLAAATGLKVARPDLQGLGGGGGGTGVRVFHPLVVALASGANFVARAFAGDLHGTAAIIAKAMQHPGFSFVEILSPCVTFRPEQREWRKMVHPATVEPTDDAARAARRLMTDDGFNIGVLYAG